jgi:hypothetical protein
MKNLNWSSLTDDLLEILIMNQTDLSAKCKVTQQSISNWKTGTRSPGVYARHVLRELAKEANLKIEDYKVKPPKKVKSKAKLDKKASVPEDILNFAQRVAALPNNQRNKIIDMAEFLLSRD